MLATTTTITKIILTKNSNININNNNGNSDNNNNNCNNNNNNYVGISLQVENDSGCWQEKPASSILIPKLMQSAMEALLENRTDVGVLLENQYFFALSFKSASHIDFYEKNLKYGAARTSRFCYYNSPP